MNEYLVTVSISFMADTPEDAARRAYEWLKSESRPYATVANTQTSEMRHVRLGEV